MYNGHGLTSINNLSELKHPAPRKLDRLFCLVHATPVLRSDPSAQMSEREREKGREREREREQKQSIDGEVISALIPRMRNDLDEFISYPIDIMMPLSDPCMRELAKSVYPSPEYNQISSRDILQLLPDRARSRGFHLDPLGTEASKGQGQTRDEEMEMEMEFKYLMISENDLLPLRSKDLCGKMNRKSENDGCEAFYCIQLSDKNILSDAERIGLTYSNMSEEKLLKHMLANRMSMSAYTHPDKISVSSVLGDSKCRPCSSRSSDMQCTQPPSQVPPTRPKRLADKELIVAERGDYGYKWEDEEPATTAIGSERDSSVLSTMCYWRSCQSEASASTCNLCAYHSDLKSFLDREAMTNLISAPSDALKYLPRKVPAISIELEQGDERFRDSRIIRAASTLLQELGEGKLKFTIRSFIRKTVEEIRCKRRLEVAAASCRKPQLANDSLEQLKCNSSLRQTGSARSSLTGARTRRMVEPGSIDPSLTQPAVVMPSPPSSPMWARWKNEDLLRR